MSDIHIGSRNEVQNICLGILRDLRNLKNEIEKNEIYTNTLKALLKINNSEIAILEIAITNAEGELQ